MTTAVKKNSQRRGCDVALLLFCWSYFVDTFAQFLMPIIFQSLSVLAKKNLTFFDMGNNVDLVLLFPKGILSLIDLVWEEHCESFCE